MASRTLVVVVAAALAGCSPVLELGVGAAPNRSFPGSGPTAILRVRQDVGSHGWCEYEHISRITVGAPFNDDRDEGVVDQVACGVRFGGREP
jgi:hypothetical protein